MINLKTLSRKAIILLMMERAMRLEISDVAARLGVSTKTVLNDVAILNKELKGTAVIEKKGSKIQFYMLDITAFLKIRREIEKPEHDFFNPDVRVSYIA